MIEEKVKERFLKYKNTKTGSVNKIAPGIIFEVFSLQF